MRHIFMHSLRVLNRQKGSLLINVTGLAIGMACSLIIGLFILHELSYERFNIKKDRIYRLLVTGVIGDREMNYAITAPAIGPAMLKELPMVENFTRINTKDGPVVKYGENRFIEDNFIEADSSFFDLFSIPLLQGDRRSVLHAPHTLVISQTAAARIFGKEDPMGKLIQVNHDKVPYQVTGIMADIPDNSHIQADMIGSFLTNPSSKDTYWGNNNLETYILLRPNTDPASVDARMPGMIRKNMGEIAQKSLGISIDDFLEKNKYSIILQPLTRMHLDPTFVQITNTRPATNPKYLYIFGSIAVLILIIAAINFMNLSIAQFTKRAKEVGIKKVSGSTRSLLVLQFLAESVGLTLVSMVITILLIENLLPFFNHLLGIRMSLSGISSGIVLLSLFVLVILIGLFAGSYPAFYLSSFKPVVIMKGTRNEKASHTGFRRILVVLQFAISIVLIVGTLIMVRQIRFMIHQDLGFNQEQLLVIRHAEAMGKHEKICKNALLRIPGVTGVSLSTAVPGHSESGRTYAVDGQNGSVMDFKINYIDDDFLKVYGMQLSSGRSFQGSFGTNPEACLVNESSVKQMGLTNPTATSLSNGFERLSIIGVIRNFHFEPLRNAINPYLFRWKDDSTHYGYVSIRLSGKANEQTIKEIHKVWDEYASDYPFQYFFMDQDFAQKYQEERQSAQLALIFTILAMVIASLGLFGLTSFTLEQRTKEIGIRKSMGATVAGIFYMISKELAILVCIATLVSLPFIYFVAKNWLQNYYYRINLRPLDFLIGFAVAMAIAMATVGYKTVRSARIDPVEALRYE